MLEKNLVSAVAYYQAMSSKDLAVLEKYLHPKVRLKGPLADVTGKDGVLCSVKHFCAVFDKLTIRAQCASGDQVMLAYDLECPPPIGLVQSAVLLTFQEGLIIRYELFYDARPFEKRV